MPDEYLPLHESEVKAEAAFPDFRSKVSLETARQLNDLLKQDGGTAVVKAKLEQMGVPIDDFYDMFKSPSFVSVFFHDRFEEWPEVDQERLAQVRRVNPRATAWKTPSSPAA